MPNACKFCLFKAEIEDENVENQDDIEKFLQIIDVLFNNKITITSDEVRWICRPCKEKIEAFYSYYLFVLENCTSIEKVESPAFESQFPESPEFETFEDDKCEVFVEPIIKVDMTEEFVVKQVDSGRKSKRLRGIEPEKIKYTFKDFDHSKKKNQAEEKNFSDDEYMAPIKPVKPVKPKPVTKRRPTKIKRNPFLEPRAKKYYEDGSESEGEAWMPSRAILEPGLTRVEREARDAMIQRYFGNKCEACGADTEYKSFALLSKHCMEEHGSRKHYICCETVLTTAKTIYEHCVEHENPVQCNFCGMVCVSSTMHKRHLLQVHGIEIKKAEETDQFQCDLCKRRYKTMEKIESHMERSHIRATQTLFVCETCARPYKSANSLDIHIRRDHLGEKLPKSQCPQCHKWLLTTGMPVHMRKHMALPPKEKFKCDKCGSEHTQYYGLLKHQKRHHSEKSKQFQCPLCPKGFFVERHFKEHYAIHTGEILYHCQWCESGFKSLGNLYAHNRKLHTELYNQYKLKRQLEREAKSRPD